jgi:predicted CXXCH cytochrome family protein
MTIALRGVPRATCSLNSAGATGMGKEAQRMKSHALRPLWVVLAIVVTILVVRHYDVPSDFGVHSNGYMYGWYRGRNIWDWKRVTVKYQGKASCASCHQKQVDANSGTPHAIIQCENCHGPALDHPTDPARLAIDKTREFCLRCHAKLPYPSSARGGLRGIDPATHHPGVECVKCHDPHHPNLTNLQSPTPNRHHGNEFCRSCHQVVVDTIVGQPHAIIYCESCHGPALNHPTDPAKLAIDKTRALCLKCHVDKADHNFGRTCVTCHDPHKSSLQFLQFLP